MRAVAMRLKGPLQSWGGPVAGDDRPTLDFPTKSGVLGIVAAALGIERHDVDGLVRLHRGLAVGVRVEARGRRGVDFHTTQGVPRAERGVAETVVSRRAYLYDASFAVLLVERAGIGVTLEQVIEALKRPRFAPYLGRRACVTGRPVLGAPLVLEGEGWLELFGQVPREAEAGAEGGAVDLFLEGELEAPGTVRVLRLRDELVGPLPRMFGERLVTHVRLAPEDGADDTVDRWFPS